MNESKSIFQLIDNSDGTRSPALCCSASEFVDACKKVYGNFNDISGEPLPLPDLSPLKRYSILVIAAIDANDNGIIDRRGISKFPIMNLHKWCYKIKFPDGVYDPDVNF